MFVSVIGKYLNNYALKESGMNVNHIPPGWSKWFGLVGNRYNNIVIIYSKYFWKQYVPIYCVLHVTK